MTTFSRREIIENLISTVQTAIMERPHIATGVDGWVHYKDGWRTNRRPDNSPTDRRDKMTLRYRSNGALYLTYNGASYPSGYLWTYLRQRFNTSDNLDVLRIMTDAYNINFSWVDYDNGRTPSTPSRRPAQKWAQTSTVPSAAPLPDESAVCIVPDSIVRRSLDFYRMCVLREWMSGLMDDVVVEDCFSLYRVGVTKSRDTLFWLHDLNGRCRSGKIMRYLPDGHRDKTSAGAIRFAHTDLIKAKLLPDGWQYSGCLFGEHLLPRYPDQTVGLVESEKTALICAVQWPEYLWLATGGAQSNLDRAAAVLAGRNVTVFPDADATAKWSERFSNIPGFAVSDLAAQYAEQGGLKYAKCDIADILINDIYDKI